MEYPAAGDGAGSATSDTGADDPAVRVVRADASGTGGVFLSGFTPGSSVGDSARLGSCHGREYPAFYRSSSGDYPYVAP